MRNYVIFSFLLLAVAQDSATKGQECRKLPGDAGWPASDVWSKALPGVVARGPQDPKVRRPDYQLTATSIAEVQAAVKFTAEHGIRLTILNSAHDFLGRFLDHSNELKGNN
jgi:hypothetical protein